MTMTLILTIIAGVLAVLCAVLLAHSGYLEQHTIIKNADTENAILIGRLKIITGIVTAILVAIVGVRDYKERRDRAEQSSQQILLLNNLDLSRKTLSDIKIDVSIKDKVAYANLKTMLAKPFLSPSFASTVFATDTDLRNCIDKADTDVPCTYEVKPTPDGNYESTIKFNVKYPGQLNEQENTFSVMIENSSWPSISRLLRASIFKEMKILDESGNSIILIADVLAKSAITVSNGIVGLEVKNTPIRLDQLKQVKLKFGMVGFVPYELPNIVQIKTTDPRVKLDQVFKIDWTKIDSSTSSFYEDGLTGNKGTGVSLISTPQQLNFEINSLQSK